MIKRFLNFFEKGKQLHIWFFSYLIIVIVGVILSFVLHSSSANIVRNQTEKNMYFTVDQMRLFYDEDFLGVQNAAYSVLNDNTLQLLAASEQSDNPVSNRLQYNTICKRISTHTDNNIKSFFVVFEDCDLVLDSTGSSSKKPVFNKHFSDYYPDMQAWIDDIKLTDDYASCKFLSGDGAENLVCYIQRTPVSTVLPVKATAVIVLNTDYIVKNRLSVAKYTNPVMTILNQNDEIVYSTVDLKNKSVISSENEDDYIKVSVPSQFMNWKYMLMIPSDSVYADLKNMQVIALLIYIIYLFAGIFLSYYLSKRSYRPLSLLMTKFGKDHINDSQNEFLYLGNQISRMFEKDKIAQKELNSHLSKLQEHYLADLLFGRSENLNANKNYRVEFKKGYFYLVLFKVLDSGILKEESRNNFDTVNFLIQNIFSEITENFGATHFFPCEDMYACIINSKKELSELEICTQTEFTVDFLRENFSTNIVCAVSDSVSSENQLSILYSQAKDIISIGLNSSNKSVLASDAMQEVSYIFPQKTEELLTAALMRGNYESCEKIINELFTLTFDNKDLIPSLKQIFFSDLVGTVLKVSTAKNESKHFLSMFNEVFHANDVNDSKCILLGYIKKLCDKVQENSTSVDERINQITEFVQDNYNDPNLNVSYIANKFDITINYLSSYFKSKTGQVLSDYILKYRLKKACEFLSQKKSVTETCHKCGFCDVNAFIRAFKKHYGITPGKYSSQN